jgi:hypothetical protein
MKTTQITAITIIAIAVTACGMAKKSTTAAPPVPPAAAPPAPLIFVKPASTGVYAPGLPELTAIQAQYSDATMEQLKEGHVLYTESACVKCHGAKNIYWFNEVQWKNIIDDMSLKARITAAQKDAVYKYVLAIKAVQPK